MTSEKNKFVEYYETASESPETMKRVAGTYKSLMACLQGDGIYTADGLKVADIGCGAGAQCIHWAKAGHAVSGIDINTDLIALAKKRANSAGVNISFVEGSAESLPWGTEQFDVCIMPELLEHVDRWDVCLDEACRIIKPGGLLFLTTTNRLCPKQQEFNLLGYSWYPAWLKRRCLELARTTKKHWVEYADYPAVNWFSPAGLANELERRGFSSLDRFDIICMREQSGTKRRMAQIITTSRLLRYISQVFTPYTVLVARNNI